METITLKLLGENDFFTQEAFKVLRTNLQFCGQEVKVIAFTSCNENDGKTMVSLQIGKSFADLGKKVLVIDADMRKSVMAGRNTTAKVFTGLSEVLVGHSKLEDCVYATQYHGLHLIFAGKYPPNPVELLNSDYFKKLLEEARKTYDYIIVDTPPLGLVIDAAVIATKCDGTVLVLGNAKVRASKAQEVLDQLKKSECRVLGVVRNRANSGKRGYFRKGYYRKGYYKHDKNQYKAYKTDS